MDMVVTASAPQKCDANATGVAATDWGMEAIPCQVRTGLRSFVDRQGITRRFCGSEGHEANAKRRFGQAMYEGMD